MTRGIVYLFIGTRHAVVAAVSLMTLRDWWNGPIALFCDETALPFAGLLAKAANARIVPFEPVKQKRHSGYLNKTLVPQQTPFDETVQLDLDTIIVGPLDGLWPKKPDEWVLTPFAAWRSTGNIVGGRIRRWRDAAPELVADKEKLNQPALNTGIMAYGPDCWLAKRVWNEVTSLNPRTFISDETAADLIIGQPQWLRYVRLLNERYNWSPCFSEPMEDRRVIHVHGRRHTRDDRGRIVWWPFWERACRENFGGVVDWWQNSGDKYFKRHMNTVVNTLDKPSETC